MKPVNFPRGGNNLPEKGTRQSKRGIAATQSRRLQCSLRRDSRVAEFGTAIGETTGARILVAKFRCETFVPRSNLGPIQNDLAAP
jgi:hypothetical protein